MTTSLLSQTDIARACRINSTDLKRKLATHGITPAHIVGSRSLYTAESVAAMIAAHDAARTAKAQAKLAQVQTQTPDPSPAEAPPSSFEAERILSDLAVVIAELSAIGTAIAALTGEVTQLKTAACAALANI